MGQLDQSRDFEALLADSTALIGRTRALLEGARTHLHAADLPVPPPRTAPRPGTRRVPLRFVMTAPAAAGLVMMGIAVGELAHTAGSPDRALSVGVAAPAASVPTVTVPAVPAAPTAGPPPTPLWVSIPRLSVRAAVAGEVQVISSGPEQGLLTAPPNYHDLGWFRQSGSGPLVLDGHVGYRSDPGPLAFIGGLQAGDQVIVGNQSSQQSYRVQAVGHVLKGQLPAQYFTSAYGQDLMLITCDYTSPFSGGHFADNVYAVAEPG